MTKKLSKKEARLQKKIEKLAKKDKKNVRLSSSVEINDKFIRVSTKPSLEKVPRSKSPSNYKECYFSWCDTYSDTDGLWSWKNDEPRAWTDEEFTTIIQPHMQSHASDSWNEVETKSYNGSGGFRKLLNKYQPLTSVHGEAQNRWSELEGLSQFDEFFRFRLGSERRIWGVRLQHHFYMVWYERHHQICPVGN
jgi:hypothetical protein